MAQAKKQTKLENSKRVNIVVTRKYGEEKHKIFASTTIIENGSSILKQFRVPVDVPVEVPVEIARILHDRKIPKFVGEKQSMVNEFTVERADSSF